MNIVIAEERNGQQLAAQSFDLEIIRLGRNAGECQIYFESEQFPMVSRQHAELRRHGNDWILFDANSTYGTFVNGQRVTQPQKIGAGSKIQLGTNGPVLKILNAGSETGTPVSKGLQTPAISEQPAESWDEPFSSASPQSVPPVPPASRPAPKTPRVAENPSIEFLDSTNSVPPYTIAKNSIWLGRDPNGDIVFDAFKVMVSRQHAQIRNQDGEFVIHDNNSFNGTLVNEQRISAPTPLYHADEIELGMGGPRLRFNSPARLAPKGASLAGQRAIAPNQLAERPEEISGSVGSQTMVFNLETLTPGKKEQTQPQLLMSLTFGQKTSLVIGRAETSDIKLDGLQISNQHARLLRSNAGVVIEDLNSTNGVYLNGTRISKKTLTAEDSLQIGSFLIRVDAADNIGVFDTRAKTRIDSVNITKDVKNRAGAGMIRLLDSVSLSIQPNEFVGMLGPSGAGKSTLMDAMNGMRPASSGSILINNLDLYQHLDSLKQSIGYVPQDDIIHRELTVYRTLYFVAKLRLSGDVSAKEIDQIIDEVLDVTGLTERRDVPINQLSGGQRKRVSIAVELITKPSLIFLDEPTSGLDPATEEKIMKLFRQIAESGRTVILTTHAMENVKLFDKIVVLMRGKLVFYGAPQEVLDHFKAESFKDLYDKLEEPIEQRLSQSGGNLQQITENVAEDWKKRFTETQAYKKNVFEPLKELGGLDSHRVQKKNRLGLFGAIRQWMTLSRRYFQVLSRDKLTLFILFAQAPIVAILTFFVMGADQPRDFVYFVLSLVSVWFGTSVAAREIIRERAIYKRERMVNLGILPYLGSKIFVLGIIVGLQCFMLFIPLKFFDIIGVMSMPGNLGGLPQLFVVFLTAAVGIALGLLISALVKTSEMATSLVPLILIPQILFSGLVGVPTGINMAAGFFMPATWSFDTMKRYSTLDTLEEEGSLPKGDSQGLGLYKFIEQENDKIIDQAKVDLEKYKKDAQGKVDDFEDELSRTGRGTKPKLGEAPEIKDAKKIPKNLSNYVTFLHPWMHEIVNQMVLIFMFWSLVLATIVVLKIQDTR